jgi:hypothetical protein
MKAFAAIGILFCSVSVLSFAQDVADWGTHSFPQDRSGMGSPFGRTSSADMGSLTGTVATLDGRPQPDVRVELRDIKSGRVLNSAYTNMAGTFSFNMLPFGTYEVIADHGAAGVRQEVDVRDSFSSVNLRLNASDPNAAPSRNALVSLAELRVPQRARDAFSKAERAIEKHRLDEASKYLQKALDIYPSYAPALTLRGALSLGKDDFTAAVSDFDKAIHADSSYAMAYGGMAAALNRQNKSDDALRAAERASSLSPNSWQPYYEMAKAYVAKTDYQRALQQLAHAQSQISQDYAPLHLLRASALVGLQNYNDGAVELKTFLRIAPNHPSASAAKGMLAQIDAFVSSSRASVAGATQPR